MTACRSAALVVLLALAPAAAVAPSAAARTQAPLDPCAPVAPEQLALGFHPTTNNVGVVDLHFFGANGAEVTYWECIGSRAQRLGTATAPGRSITSLHAATPWLCGRTTRRFAAAATLPEGRLVRFLSSVQTRSCRHRLSLHVPARVRRGAPLPVRVVDSWALGGRRARLCLIPPPGSRERRTCGAFALPAGAPSRTKRLRPASHTGVWTVELHAAGARVARRIAVGVRPVPVADKPLVLATGDSTMQGVESALSDELGDDYTVLGDVRPGRGISLYDWPSAAARQARRRPVATVVSIGAAEGFDLRPPATRAAAASAAGRPARLRRTSAPGGAVACCGEAWIAEYARRVRSMMRTYRAATPRSRVLYLTIVRPRDPRRDVVVRAVNEAIVRAGTGLARVTVLRADLLFTPDGYRPTMRDGGREVAVSEADGVHLNASGTAIEGREAAKAVRGLPNAFPTTAP